MTDPIDRLAELFIGTWRGTATVAGVGADGGGEARCEWRVQSAADRRCVIVDYVEERPEQPRYAGHGVHLWDPVAQTLRAYWFASVGPAPIGAPATLVDSTYRYQQASARGQVRFTYAWSGDRFEFTIEASPDGDAWSIAQAGHFVRVAEGGERRRE